MAEPPVTVLGATGYTGRLIAAEAARQGLRVCLAGRRRDALTRAAGELGMPRADVAVANVQEPSSLARLAESSSVLVNAVGAYSRLGEPVVDAAVRGGCHYVDLAAEVGFLEWVFAQHDRAAHAGVTVCPGCGVQGAPGGLLAAVAAERLDDEVVEARVAYLVRGARLSRGSARAALEVAAVGGVAWRGGRLVVEPVAAERWRVPFPPPLGPQGAVSAPLADTLFVGDATAAATARTYGAVPASSALPVLAGPLDVIARRLARTRFVRRVVEWLPEGPDARARSAARFAVLTELVGLGGAARAWARGRDLYATTARVAVGAARRLADDGTPPGGVRTPAQLVGADAKGFLDESGLRWSEL